jgi:hypothetical protein
MTKKIITILILALLLQNKEVSAQRRRTSKQASSKKSSSKSSSKKSRGKTATRSSKKTNNNNVANSTTSTEVVELSKDTLKPGVVTITSSYKPTLRSAAKINFTASPTVIDTNRFTLNYSIPAQNLFFKYQPVPIKPISLVNDSSIIWVNKNYVKIGFGNFSTPFIDAGFSFGHPSKTVYTVQANYVSSKADVPFMEFTKASIKANAQINSLKNESNIGLHYSLSQQFRYGINGGIFTPDLLRNNFNTIGIFGSLKSKAPNEKGISVNPFLKLDLFTDNKSGSEINAYVNAPINKHLSDNFSLQLGVMADVASFSNTASKNLSTSIIGVQPSVSFSSKSFIVKAGLYPTWSNTEFALLPNIVAETNLLSDKFKFFAGWQSSFTKNSYQALANVNPFIVQPTALENTKISEQFVGFKGSLNTHISFNAQVGLQNFNNMALYINDSTNLKSQDFLVVYEPSLSALSIKGEINYTLQDKLSIAVAAKITQFTQQQKYDKAFGFMPLELSGFARYKLFKDLQLKADVFFFGGSPYRTKTLQSDRLAAGIDVNVGAEFAVLNKLNVWLQINNLLNSQYQRWNQYNVLGLNLVGGVRFTF